MGSKTKDTEHGIRTIEMQTRHFKTMTGGMKTETGLDTETWRHYWPGEQREQETLRQE